MTRTGMMFLTALLVEILVCDTSAQTGLGPWVSAAGGGVVYDGTYVAALTTGQSVIGRATSATYAAGSGFWGDGGVILDVKEPLVTETPTTFALWQNYPNPFNPSTNVRYELPTSSDVRLSVYDLLGREVSVLVNERKEAGVHQVTFDASDLASGVYFYRLQAGDFVQTHKLCLVR